MRPAPRRRRPSRRAARRRRLVAVIAFAIVAGSVTSWRRRGRPCRSMSGARPATRCTRTPRCSASCASRSLRPSPSSSTPRCGSARAAGRRGRCPRPTAPARSPRRSICARTRPCSSTATGVAWHTSLLDRPVGAVTRELLEAARDARGRVRDRPDAAGGAVERAARRRRDATARTTREQVERYFAAATQAALVLSEFRAPFRGRSTAGERVVGLLRPRRQPVLGRARRAAIAGLHHAQRDGRAGGRDRVVAGRRPLRARGLLRVRPPGRARLRGVAARAAREPLGRPARRVPARLGRRLRERRPARRAHSTSPARPSCTPARRAAGTPSSPRAPRGARRRSSSRAPTGRASAAVAAARP